MVVKQFFGEYAPYCFSCGSDRIREQDSEYVCASCGCVLSAVAPNNVVKSRVPVLDNRLGTGLSRKFDGELEGLNKLNKELWSDRTESEILIELRRITSAMNLPHAVAENALRIIKKAREEGLMAGRSKYSFVAACVGIACREAGIPRTLKEIIQNSKGTNREVRRIFRDIVQTLGIKARLLEPSALVFGIVKRARLPEEVGVKALKVIELTRREVIGNSPSMVAASAVYLVQLLTNYTLTQDDVARASNVSVIALRNATRKIVKSLDIKTLQTVLGLDDDDEVLKILRETERVRFLHRIAMRRRFRGWKRNLPSQSSSSAKT